MIRQLRHDWVGTALAHSVFTMKTVTEFHCEACHELLREDDSLYGAITFDGKKFFTCECGRDKAAKVKVRKDEITYLDATDLSSDENLGLGDAVQVGVEAMMLWIAGVNSARAARYDVALVYAEQVKEFNALHGTFRYANPDSCISESKLDHDKRAAMQLPITLTELEIEERYGAKSIPRWCRNGYVQIFSDDSRLCEGCGNCRTLDSTWSSWSSGGDRHELNGKALRAAWSFGRMMWLAARVEVMTPYARALEAFNALGRIGQAIAAALSPGLGLGVMAATAKKIWNTPTEGGWYRVVGGRGAASKCKGFVGQLVRVFSDSDYGTLRAKLVSPSGDVRTVAVTQIERIPAPAIATTETPKAKADAEKAAYLARPVFSGRKGDLGIIHSGQHAGNSGVVFWKSDDGNRLGVKSCSCKRRCDHAVMWCNARDVSAPNDSNRAVA